METEYELALQYDDSQGTNIAVAPTYPSYCEQYESETSGTAQEKQEQIEKYMEEGCQELGEDAVRSASTAYTAAQLNTLS